MHDDSLDGMRQILCQEIGDEDNIEGDDDITEEVEPLRMPRNPVLPSAAEIEEHRKTHIPFRCWCIECLMGRGLGEQRGAHAGRDHGIPRVGGRLLVHYVRVDQEAGRTRVPSRR